MPLERAVSAIEDFLRQGITQVGFVSPSHQMPQMKAVIASLRERGNRFISVMNTSAYDRVETIASLRDAVDIYLPDMKYMDPELALRLSGTPDYPEVAEAAITEMFRQKGKDLVLDESGLAKKGLIIRHLVLPGHVDNSLRVLRFISEKLSPEVHLSLMAQYYPTPAVEGDPVLGRPLSENEYSFVLEEMERLGFTNGWVQELESRDSCRPDFDSEDIFRF
jgi:putative pyruvate formate lyase activating enzyme